LKNARGVGIALDIVVRAALHVDVSGVISGVSAAVPVPSVTVTASIALVVPKLKKERMALWKYKLCSTFFVVGDH
jgi:hypothetical protein